MKSLKIILILLLISSNLKAQQNNYIAQDASFFPISVATQSTWNAISYKKAGINLYITLWNPLDSIQLSQLHKANMKVICTQNDFALKNLNDSIIFGWDQGDEPDNAQWNDVTKDYDPCINPQIIIDQYLKYKAKDPTRPIYLNLGQGVAWREWYGRGSKCFGDFDSYKISKNGYIKGTDIISFDIYPVNGKDTATKEKLWLVPKGIDSLYSWGNNEKPAWCWIETTRISESGSRKPTTKEVKTEVWMALVHEAKGIGYFCHSWYPSFVEYALLRDSVMLDAVTKINNEITSLAIELNSPTIKNYASVFSSNPKVPIDIMVKSTKSNYIFAVAMRNDTTTATFTVIDGKKVDVIGENRSIDVVNGKFTDKFDSYGVHLYQVQSTSSIVKEDLKFNKLNLFPNPTSDLINVHLQNNFLTSQKIQIFDLLGQKLIEKDIPIGSENFEINISNLLSGIYLLKIDDEVQRVVKR